MKRIIFIVAIIFAQFTCAQDCKISFDKLLVLVEYTRSDFETFALKNGFSYDIKNNLYYCDKKDVKNNGRWLKQIEKEGFLNVDYFFQDKLEYLNFKEILEKGELFETKEDTDSFLLKYMLNGNLHYLSTISVGGKNTYMVSIGNYK